MKLNPSQILWLVWLARRSLVHGFCLQRTALNPNGLKSPDSLMQTLRLDAKTVPESTDSVQDQYSDSLPKKCRTKQSTVVLSKKFVQATPRPWLSPLRRLFRRNNVDDKQKVEHLNFCYDFDELEIGSSGTSNSTIGVVLVHPIGVGIGKWFYQRLLTALSTRHDTESSTPRLVVVSPDLLGSGSAGNPTMSDGQELQKLPLLNISDWTDQIVDLMAKTEKSANVDRWCVVANGGCSPIALQVAQRSVEGTVSFHKKVSNVILSSVPRLPFFLQAVDPLKVAKSYKTLCGIPGKLFWWYSCRNEGAFIQKFSEKNLVADPENLGDQWRPNCYETAKMHGGKSRYTTFAFLAGTLQDGCVESLRALKDGDVRIDIIKGRDVRRNQAKSWFWQKSKRKPDANEKLLKTFREFLEESGNGGREALIGGRISLAHEDSQGYSDALVAYLGAD